MGRGLGSSLCSRPAGSFGLLGWESKELPFPPGRLVGSEPPFVFLPVSQSRASTIVLVEVN